jgi:transposase
VLNGLNVQLLAPSSSGGKDRLGSISKQGDRYLRSLFVAGALAAARLRYIVGTAWSTKCYMNMRPLYQPQLMQTEVVA